MLRVWLIDNPGSGSPGQTVLQQYAAAIQRGILGDYAAQYNRGCNFAYGDARDVSPGDQVLDLVATMDQPGALGNHSPDVFAHNCDAVESDPGYTIDGVTLSNFVWASWYTGTGAKFDQLGTLKAPYTVSAGGYAQKLDPTAGWQQIQSSELAPRAYRQKWARRRLRRVAKWLAQRGGVL